MNANRTRMLGSDAVRRAGFGRWERNARRKIRSAAWHIQEAATQSVLLGLVVVLALANTGLFGLIMRQPVSAATTVNLDFSSDALKDNGTTTANWDTASGTVILSTNPALQYAGNLSDDLNPSTSVPDVAVYGVSFVSSSTGYVSGNAGNVWKTTDSGYSWTSVDTPNAGAVNYDVDCTDASTCWVVNENGDIFFTDDGGTTWDTQRTGDGSSGLYDLEMVSSTVGWAAGGGAFGPALLLKTTDGGSSWNSVTSGFSGTYIAAVVSTSTNDVVIKNGGVGNVRYSHTGGSSFSNATDPSDAAFVVGHTMVGVSGTSTMWSVDTLDDFVSPRVLRSYNGGRAWSAVDAGFTNSPQAVGMNADGSGVLICAGAECRYTTDGGATWNASTGEDNLAGPYTVQFVSTTSAYLVDTSSAQGTFVGYTMDGGATIALVGSAGLGIWPTADNVKAVAPSQTASSTATLAFSADPEHRRSTDDFSSVSTPTGLGSVTVRDAECTDTACVAATDGGVYYSTDGGAAWSQSTISGGGSFTREANGVALVGTTVAYALVPGNGTDTRIYRSTDGGAVFSLVHTVVDDSSFMSVDCATATTCWAVMLGGYFTTALPDDGTLRAAAGGAQAVFGTTNGTTWTSQLDLDSVSTGPAQTSGSVAAVDEDTVFVVGSGLGNNALVSTDGGANWSESAFDDGTALNTIACNAEATCFAGGDSGYLIYSNDDGDTWTAETSGVGAAIRDVEFGDDYRAYFSTAVRAIKRLSLEAGTVSYQAANTVRTSALDATADLITDATLTVSSTTPANTTITSFLSNDGGTTWTTSTPGTTVTFPTGGSDLRYRADLTTSDNAVTPTLDSISISFNTLVVEAQFTAGGLQMNPVDAFDHLRPRVVADGDTGGIAVWEDYRDDGVTSNLYAQRINDAGTALWTAGGQRIAASSSYQMAHQAVADGAGGVIVFWSEDPAGSYPAQRIVGMRLDADGNTLWGPTTFLHDASGIYSLADMISDEAGGVVIAYYQSDDSFLRAARIDGSGTVLWTQQVSTNTAITAGGTTHKRPFYIRMAIDQAQNKVLVGFTEGHLTGGGTRGAFIQRLDSITGTQDYGADAVEVATFTAATYQASGAHILGLGHDNAGGFVMAVLGVSDTDGNFLQEDHLYVVYGTPATMATTTIFSGETTNFVQTSDNGDGFFDDDGNLYFAHGALNGSSQRTLLLYKVAPTGTNLWGSTVTDGTLSWQALQVDTETGIFPKPRVAPDGEGGVFISWLYEVAAFTTIGVRMQHVTPSQTLLWPTATTNIGEGDYDGSGDEFMHQPIVVSSSSAYLFWDENNVFVQSMVQSQSAASSPGGSGSSGGGVTEDANTVPANPAPGTPEARNTSSIRWKFTDRSSFETGFQLRHEPAGKDAVILHTTEPILTTNLTYIDETQLEPNTRYCSRVVRALNAKGLSKPTQLPCAYTLAAVPTDVLAQVPSATTRVVSWKDGGNGTSTEYAVFEKNGGQWVGPNGALQKDPFWQTRDAWGGDAGVTVNGLDAKKEYVFQVFVRNGDGKESLPVTAGIGVPSSEVDGGMPVLVLKKSVAINPFGAAVAAIGLAAGAAAGLLAVLFAGAVMAFSALHRRAGAGLCLAGVCRLLRSPAHSYVSGSDGPSAPVHRGVHRLGQVSGLAALGALLVQAAATVLLTLAPQLSAAATFTGDGNAVATGDLLTYQVAAVNDGNASATSVALTDVLPIGLAYVPGSLTVNGVKQSDACDNDAACYRAGTKTVSLAYPSIAPGDAVILAFNATVTIAPGQGNDLVLLRNSACATAKQLEDAACSNETLNPVAAAPLSVNQNVNQQTNANANVPQRTNTNQAFVNGNVNRPTNGNQNVNENANRNVNAPADVPPAPPAEEQPAPPEEEKETQITINNAEPSTETPTTDPTPEIQGTSAPGSLVLLTIDERVAGVAYAGENGRFSFTPDRPLGEGEHTVAVSLDGVVFDSARFAVDTQAPGAVNDLSIIVTKVDLAVSIRAAITGQTSSGRDATIQVSGRTSPDTRLVRIRVESDPIEVSFVPPAPAWTREITGRFDPGIHTVTAFAYDAAGNVSASAQKTFVIPEPEFLETPLAMLDSPEAEAVATVSAPILPAVAAANVAVAAGIPTLFNFLGLLLTQPALLFARKEKKGYGTVFNALSKLPVDLAIVRIRDADNKRILQTKVTDRLGRYVFFLNPGAFSVEVTKQGYVHPTTYLSGKTEDVAYTDVLSAGGLVLDQNTRLAKNIPLDPVEDRKTPAAITRAVVLRKLQYAFALSGPILSLVTFVVTPTLLAGALLLVQILFFALFRRLAYKKPPKSFGIVRDETTGKPLKNAVIRIFETTYNKLLETQVTDARGRYAFLVGQSRYYVTAQAAGYQTLTTEPIDFSSVQKGGLVARDIALRAGNDAPPAPPAAPPPAPIVPPAAPAPVVPPPTVPMTPPAHTPMVPPVPPQPPARP